MSKCEEILRMKHDMNEQPELKEKLEAEIKRILEAGEVENDGEAMVKAAAARGYTITLEELERAAADLEELDDDELEAAGGVVYSPGFLEESVNSSEGCDKVQNAFNRAKKAKTK